MQDRCVIGDFLSSCHQVDMLYISAVVVSWRHVMAYLALCVMLHVILLSHDKTRHSQAHTHTESQLSRDHCFTSVFNGQQRSIVLVWCVCVCLVLRNMCTCLCVYSTAFLRLCDALIWISRDLKCTLISETPATCLLKGNPNTRSTVSQIHPSSFHSSPKPPLSLSSLPSLSPSAYSVHLSVLTTFICHVLLLHASLLSLLSIPLSLLSPLPPHHPCF